MTNQKDDIDYHEDYKEIMIKKGWTVDELNYYIHQWFINHDLGAFPILEYLESL